MKKKKVAFIFAFPIRTNPILITMPFGLNVITLLDRKGYEIDVYLSEYRSQAYQGLFSENVKFHFLDHNYIWPKEGKWSYYFLTTYFKFKSFFTLRNKYSHVFASGMAGVTLGAILKRVNKKSSFVYMNDEFPVQGERNIWVNAEIKSALKADFVSTPDESRYPPLCAQIPSLAEKEHFPLPNTPLRDEIQELPTINWHQYFGIDEGKKIFLMAGGLQEFNLITELLSSVKNWPEEAVLILKGKNDIKGFREKYDHLDIPGKIFWTAESFSPDKLHSLIQYSSASMCLYRHINDNLTFVGKSSGKLMRSVLLGRPVIVSKAKGFEFVDDLGVGITVEGENGITEGVRYILKNEKKLAENCLQHYDEISFESYWKGLENALKL